MNKQFLFTFALKEEGESFKKSFPAADVIITGVGGKNVLRRLKKIKNFPDLIIHSGFAGSLGKFRPFDIVLCKKVLYANRFFEIETPFFHSILKSLGIKFKEGVLITLERGVMDKKLRNEIFSKTGADIVDMESFFILEWAIKKGVEVLVLKIVSDMADKNAEKSIKKNTRILSKKLADVLIKINEGRIKKNTNF